MGRGFVEERKRSTENWRGFFLWRALKKNETAKPKKNVSRFFEVEFKRKIKSVQKKRCRVKKIKFFFSSRKCHFETFVGGG